MSSPETTWSEWQWDAGSQLYYQRRINAYGKTEYRDPNYQPIFTEMLSSTTTDFSHQSTASTGGYVQDAYPQARYQQGGSQHMWHEEMSSPNSYATYSSAQSPLQSSISSAQTSSQIYGLSLTDQRRTDSTQNGSTQLRIYKPWSRDYEAKTSGPISSQSLTGVSPARQPQHVRAETSQIISAMRDPCASYKVIPGDKISKFFTPGKVFSAPWPEPSSSGAKLRTASTQAGFDINDAATVVSVSNKFIGEVFVEIRRFIVVKARTHHSLCVPISTHQRRGVVGRPDARHHSIIYNKDQEPPLPLEGEILEKHAISMIPEADSEELHPTSRINFSQT